MGGIADLDGLDEATRSKIIAEVRSAERVPISDGAIEYLAIRSGHLCYVDPAANRTHPKRVCLNKGEVYNRILSWQEIFNYIWHYSLITILCK